jgi:hypothetical protein
VSEMWRTERKVIAEQLCSAVDALVEFVDRYGPYERTDRFSYEMIPGGELTADLRGQLIKLDAKIKELCIRLGIAPPDCSSEPSSPSEILFGYTKLRIDSWYSDEQPIFGPVLKPTVDWKHRMRALRVLAEGFAGPSVPKWDKSERTLYYRGSIIKKYSRHSAPNHMIILNAFELSGWASSISDPLPREPNIVPSKRLHDTLRNMNSGLSAIRFFTRGDGITVGWEARPVSQ